MQETLHDNLVAWPYRVTILIGMCLKVPINSLKLIFRQDQGGQKNMVCQENIQITTRN